MQHQLLAIIFHGFILLLDHGSSASHQRRGLGAGVSQVADFDCPEEFGYYPHPTDCTQYYVCVFGGALLESCTGGLMYSHELQTCDWPRNVGCGESGNSDSGTVSTIRVTDPRTRAPQHSRASNNQQQQQQQQNTAAPQTSRNSHRQDFIRHRQPEVIQQQLYTEEDLGPAEEIESDRQQRVYRGQPSTIGQVQRDRDGLRTLKSGVHSQNVIPTGPDSQEKISVVSYGGQRQSQTRQQDQYSLTDGENQTFNRDFYTVTETTDNGIDNIAKTRRKRQIPLRVGSYQLSKTPKIPIILIPGGVMTDSGQQNVKYVHSNPTQGAYMKPDLRPRTSQYDRRPDFGYQNFGTLHGSQPHFPRVQLNMDENNKKTMIRWRNENPFESEVASGNDTVAKLRKLTETTIQTEFRPMMRMFNPLDGCLHCPRYMETAINHYQNRGIQPNVSTAPRIIVANFLYKLPNVTQNWKARFRVEDATTLPTTAGKTDPIAGKTKISWRPMTNGANYNMYRAIATEMPVRYTENSDLRKSIIQTYTEQTPKNSPPDVTTKRMHITRFSEEPITDNIYRSHYRFIETPKGYQYKPKISEDGGAAVNSRQRNRITHHNHDYDTSTKYNYNQYENEYYDDDEGIKNEDEITENAGITSDEYERRTNSKNETKEEDYFASYKNNRTEAFYNDREYDVETSGTTTEFKDHDHNGEWDGVRPKTNRTNVFQPSGEVADARSQSPMTTDQKLHAPGDRANLRTVQAVSDGLTRPLRYRSTTPKPSEQNQAEPSLKKLSEEQRENFKTFPIRSLTLDDEQQPHQKNQFDGPTHSTVTKIPDRDGVDQVQSYQVTSSLPSLPQTPRTVERYNTSQRYQPNQYDQYYTVYDEDADFYRQNDYVQQNYHTPSSTPSSNIVHQYRGQTTFKQQQQQQQQTIELESQRDAIDHQQPLRNAYGQDVYSPSPIIQDYNDHYSAQIDDQQYQHLGPSTPKSLNRSVSTNSSRDTFPQSSITVSRISDNKTSKTETDTVNRRSDSNYYFQPSTLLTPPPKLGQSFKKPPDTGSQFGSTVAPVTQRSSEPPRNGGALAKTLNNFDSLLTSFFSAIGKQNPIGRGSPETIVRSEIGRIHHDPIIITDDYGVHDTYFRKNGNPSPAARETTPSAQGEGDYLAYFVEIEPKKPKKENVAPVLVAPRGEVTLEPTPRIVTKENLREGQSDEVRINTRSRNRPYGNFVRLNPSEEGRRNVQLSASLNVEPILKSPTQEQSKLGGNRNEGDDKNRKSQTFREGQFHPVNRANFEVNDKPKGYTKERPGGQPEVVAERQRPRGNTLFRPRPLQEEEPKLIENASPYKFVVVETERTTEKQLSSPAPFIRNPENEERNRNEVKNRSRFRSPEVVKPDREPRKFEIPTESNIIKTDDEESDNSDASKELESIAEDEEEEEDRVEDEGVGEEEEEGGEEEEEEEASEELAKKPEKAETSSTRTFPAVAPTTSTRKPFRIRVTAESDSEENKKLRRIVKIHKGELGNQRLNNHKYKRIRKPSPRVPVTAPEDLSFNKENEIQSTYKPIIVVDSLGINKELYGVNRSSFSLEREGPGDLSKPKFGSIPAGNSSANPDTIPRGFEKPKAVIFPSVEMKPVVVANREPSSSEKPLFLITSKPQTYRNVTVHENRATTTKPYVRGKFKPSDNSKIRFRPTTASDSETTPGPHLSTRQPSYTIGSTANEVTVNRGTSPSTNRGTRPTLKPSTAIVSKASEFIDIYRYPPRRPQNLYATPTPDKSAAKCRKDVCLLPDCSCGGKDIPGGYSAEEIPQLVLLTFDDSVNDLNKGLYSDLFERGRVNPNGCPISATFYVSHEWTDYSQVQNLYANGHEIASHSITHSFGEQFSQKKWTKEIAGQREILAAYGGVRMEDIRGMRAPFLAVGGNKMFKMLYDSNFTYDSSMPIYENRPPSWPYTLDYKLFHDCMIPPCPTKSYPGVWEVPMVMWQDLNGGRCSMGDACSNPPTADGVYKMLIKNFERHFTTNRAPFGLYYHAAWFTHEHHKEGFIAFLDTIVNMPEVWLVTSWQAIEWVRDPQPLSTVENFPPFQCNTEKAKKCNNPKVCNLWHKSGVRYMRTCQPCPDVYPWTGRTGVKNSRVDNEIIDD